MDKQNPAKMDLFKGKPETPPEMAFPLYAVIPGKLQGQATAIIQSGLTLRDYFAGHALMSTAHLHDSSEACAKKAYEYADAMMKARKEVSNDNA